MVSIRGLILGVPNYGASGAESILQVVVSASRSWNEGDGPIALTPSATVSNVDNEPITAIEIVVADETDADAVLVIGGTSFPLGSDKTAQGTADTTTFDITYVAATGTFTIVEESDGDIPLTHARNLIRGITYDNTSETITEGDRTLTFTISDGASDSDPDVLTLTVTTTPDPNDPPEITFASTASYTENASATVLDNAATLSDDGGAIESITLELDTVPDGNDEELTIAGVAFPLGTNGSDTGTVGGTEFAIAYTAATRTAVITVNGGGMIPEADGQSLLRALAYEHASDDPTEGDRVLTITVDDGDDTDSAQCTITVTAVNDPPVVDFDPDD